MHVKLRESHRSNLALTSCDVRVKLAMHVKLSMHVNSDNARQAKFLKKWSQGEAWTGGRARVRSNNGMIAGSCRVL